MSSTRALSPSKQVRSNGEANVNNCPDEHDKNQEDDVEEKIETHQAIPNYSENQLEISGQVVTNDPLSVENQALMRTLQVHRTFQLHHDHHHHRLRYDTANNMIDLQEDPSGLIRGVLGLEQSSPQALPAGFQQRQQLLIDRRRRERLGLDLSHLIYSQLLFPHGVAVQQNDQFQDAFLERILRTRTIAGQTTTGLVGARRASIATDLPVTSINRNHQPTVMGAANSIFSLSSISPVQNMALTEHIDGRQTLPSDTSQLNDLSLSHEEATSPFNDYITSYSSKDYRLPVEGPESFPMVLHRALLSLENNPGGETVAAFLPDGLSFRIQNRTEFEKKCMRTFFPRMKGYASFQRQLNLYGFRRCMDGRYWHECFARHDPSLLTEMRRIKIKRNRPSGKKADKGHTTH